VTAPAIVGTPSILFLGAGASQPYGKMLMADFVRSFRKKNEHVSGGPAPIISNPLLDAICGQKEDLEFLIEELEILSSLDYLGRQTFNLSPPIVLSEQKERWSGISQLAIEATRLLGDLRKEVYLHYRAIAEPARTKILKEPLSLIRSGSHPAVVFTTNYDPAVEKFCAKHQLRLIDGFVHDEQTQEYIWSRDAFDRFAASHENSLVLFKLHGSTNWVRDQSRIVKSPASVYDVSDPEYKNVMIYPATNKVATKEPFFTAYDYLERCLDATSFCLVVGYSFRDYDTVMRFKSASLSNKGLRIAVLDPYANKICEGLKSDGISASPINYTFGGPQEAEYLALLKSAAGGRI
jgi:hypothetical protein